ncbi:kazal-type proteinase inhibitor 1 (macronuclear) [Tetrahymena thermophila SB210]|uniref:Kazal-type proteinase inhibitor 1 n=1 Tax=Tetrahymena thermophila (strain SB210) TaxID=312017 RepID=I7LZF5_TETTS|nr:kazal-type proteinase inhibitor 1 [Tetrahymena thermophila SB210]EAR83788.1 kazal-type proteinase inhibitor 1 [Tetrahymena thermophila SB210]|eukprot:XP_001031451.1 kazal-type proteinase inhibitor 1 [Tetrahymena thermophila SB210]
MMKVIFLALIVCLCKAANFKCEDSQKNLSFCTKEYLPVCGVVQNSIGQIEQFYKTFSNKCEACISGKIEFYALGECEEYPKQAIFCHPDDSQNDTCTKEYRPVCGVFDNKTFTLNQSLSQTYSNSCLACIDENVSYYIPQSCQVIFDEKQKLDQDEKIDLIFNLLN